jgi:hypothetical protein
MNIQKENKTIEKIFIGLTSLKIDINLKEMKPDNTTKITSAIIIAISKIGFL